MLAPRHVAAPSSGSARSDWRRAFALLRHASLRSDADEDRMVYVVADRPSAPAAFMVLRNAEALADDGITVAAIFRRLSPCGADAAAMAAFAREYGPDDLRRYVRLFDFSACGDMRERITLGRVAQHTGPSLRTSAPRRSAGEIVDIRNRPQTAELARAAFSSAWAATRPVDPAVARSLAARWF